MTYVIYIHVLCIVYIIDADIYFNYSFKLVICSSSLGNL